MKKLTLLLLFLFIINLFLLNTIFAAEKVGTGKDIVPPKPVTLTDPLGGKGQDPNTLIRTIISAVLGIVGSLALLMFIYGGLTWMTAAGGKEKIQKGKDILVWATVGLIIIFMSYAIVRFVLEKIIGGA